MFEKMASLEIIGIMFQWAFIGRVSPVKYLDIVVWEMSEAC